MVCNRTNIYYCFNINSRKARIFMAMRIKKQIEILKEAKEIFLSGKYYGLCLCINHAFFNKNLWDQNIPIFNKEHISELCSKNNLPDVWKGSGFWWDVYDVQTRAKVLDLLIEELESKTLSSKIKKLFRRRMY